MQNNCIISSNEDGCGVALAIRESDRHDACFDDGQDASAVQQVSFYDVHRENVRFIAENRAFPP